MSRRSRKPTRPVEPAGTAAGREPVRSRRPRAWIVVMAGAAAVLAALVSVELHRRWSGIATVRIVNQRSSALEDVRLVHAGGEEVLPRIRPGGAIEWRFKPSAAGKIGLRSRGMNYAEFHVVPGGTVRVVLKD